MLEEEEGDLEDLPGVRCGDSSVGEVMGTHCKQVGTCVPLGCVVDQGSREARHGVADSLKGTGILCFDVIIVMAALVEVAEDAHKLPFVGVVELAED